MSPPRRPWLVLGASLLLSFGAAGLVSWSASARDAARFENAVQGANDRILSRLQVYGTTLRGLAGLFAASDSVTPADFHTYADRLGVQRRFPGILGLGWSERLAGEEERHAIRYLDPLDERNRAALGYDMYAELTRREAMARARDTGGPALSGRVTLVQEIFGPTQAGFLLYLPVYHEGDVPATVDERRRLLHGFVYAPFRASDLFAGIFGTEAVPRVSFRVYDGSPGDSASLLYASRRSSGHEPSRTARHSLIIAGRPWTVTYASEPVFERGSLQYLAGAILVVGLLVSALLFLLARAEARARRTAEEANLAKSRFLATMSHELRTPLNAIGGYAELLAIGVYGPVTAAQVGAVERIDLAQRHLLGLIEDVLDYAKLEAGRLAVRPEELFVRELMESAEPLVTVQAESRGVEYLHEGGAIDARVRADPAKARQILLNLLSNAVKFTHSGGRVEVGWTVADRSVAIHVRDTGIGIPADQIEAIFHPFKQIDGDLSRSHAGTGLGLAISRELARAMGGDVTVESEPGVGSTFTLRLPTE